MDRFGSSRRRRGGQDYSSSRSSTLSTTASKDDILKKINDKVRQLEREKQTGRKTDDEKKKYDGRIKYLMDIGKKFKDGRMTKEKVIKELNQVTGPRTDSKSLSQIINTIQIQDLKYKALIDDIRGDVDSSMRAFLRTGDTMGDILQTVIEEIIKDKSMIRTIKEDKKLLDKQLKDLKERNENAKLGYKKIIKENEKLRDENRDIVNYYEKQVSVNKELDNKNKHFKDKTREILYSKNVVDNKLQKIDSILNHLNKNLGKQMEVFDNPDKEIMDEMYEDTVRRLTEELEGGGKSKRLQIIKKLDIDTELYPVVKHFFKGKYKKKGELIALSNVLDINLDNKDNKTDILKKLTKRLKLTKSQVKYLKESR